MLEFVVPLGALAALLILGVHIGPSLAISGTLGVTFLTSWDVASRSVGESAFFTSSNYVLTTIPTFVLMAELLVGGVISKKLFNAANSWTSGMPGGLAVATIGASAGMGAISGVSAASSATMSAVAVPEMRRHGYGDRLALGSVAAGGTLSVLIPPSVTLIVYGILTETSITKLFVAGILPGILTAVSYIVVIIIWAVKNKESAPSQPRFKLTERVRSLAGVWPVLILFALVLGGLYGGIVTPTEAGALGAAGALVVSLTVGGLTIQGAVKAVGRALRTTCMIFLILFGANIFANYLALTRIAQDLTSAVAETQVSKFIVVIVLGALLLVLGMFLDTLSVLVLTIPIAFPLLGDLGYEPIWIGIFAVKMIEIGLITPPIGMNIFTAVGALKTARIQDAFAGSVRFIAAELVVAAAIVLIPAIVLWLPSTGAQ